MIAFTKIWHLAFRNYSLFQQNIYIYKLYGQGDVIGHITVLFYAFIEKKHCSPWLPEDWSSCTKLWRCSAEASSPAACLRPFCLQFGPQEQKNMHRRAEIKRLTRLLKKMFLWIKRSSVPFHRMFRVTVHLHWEVPSSQFYSICLQMYVSIAPYKSQFILLLLSPVTSSMSSSVSLLLSFVAELTIFCLSSWSYTKLLTWTRLRCSRLSHRPVLFFSAWWRPHQHWALLRLDIDSFKLLLNANSIPDMQPGPFICFVCLEIMR